MWPLPSKLPLNGYEALLPAGTHGRHFEKSVPPDAGAEKLPYDDPARSMSAPSCAYEAPCAADVFTW